MDDDDEIGRAVVTEQLEATGCVVLSAASGASALALLDSGAAVDLIVSDLSMPGMDGMALIKEAQRRNPGLPARHLPCRRNRCGGALSGTFSLLRKPVDGTNLAERVAVLLAGANIRP